MSLDAFIGKPCNLLSEAALSQAFPGDKVEPTATRTGSDSPGCVVDMPKGGRSLFVHLYPRSARSPLTSGFLQGKDKPGYAEGTVGGLPSVSYGAKDTQAECTVIVGTTEKSGIGVTYRHTEGSEPRGEACAIAEYALAEAIRTLRR